MQIVAEARFKRTILVTVLAVYKRCAVSGCAGSGTACTPTPNSTSIPP
jgi:hypothetical protein